MSDTILKAVDDSADLQTALAVARGYLDGHEDLQRRFDIMIQHLTSSAVDVFRERFAKSSK